MRSISRPGCRYHLVIVPRMNVRQISLRGPGRQAMHIPCAGTRARQRLDHDAWAFLPCTAPQEDHSWNRTFAFGGGLCAALGSMPCTRWPRGKGGRRAWRTPEKGPLPAGLVENRGRV